MYGSYAPHNIDLSPQPERSSQACISKVFRSRILLQYLFTIGFRFYQISSINSIYFKTSRQNNNIIENQTL